ncbi:MAG: hypothetical protein ACYDBQ_11940 [Thermoplasmatota archaeon]
MARFGWAGFVLAGVMIIPGALAADPPTSVTATYDSNTENLNFSWTAPASGDVHNYNVYRDGFVVASPVGTSWTDNLSGWSGSHTYVVTTVDNAGAESIPSTPIHVFKASGIPGSGCSIVDVTVYYSPPGVFPTVHTDCIPV